MKRYSAAAGTEAAPPEPFIFFRGQPYSRERASARQAELITDSAYRTAALNGDH
jgi:hypothetical protein